MKLTRAGLTDFSGGIRTVGAIRDLGENEVLDATNFLVTPSGGLVKRYGSQKVMSLPLGAAVISAAEWSPSFAAVSWLVVQANNGHVYTTRSDDISYPATFSDLGAVVSSTHAGIVGFRDGVDEVVYVADGGPLNKWDASSFIANLAGTPSVTQIVVYNRRLFGFIGDTLYWSDLDNGDTLGVVASGGGSARIRTFGGGPIVGLAVVGTTLFIWHNNGVSRFRGWSQDDIDIDSGTSAVNNPVGLKDWRGVAVLNGYAYWVSPDGHVYRLSETGDVEEVGKKISTAGTIGGVVAVANKEEREIWLRGISPNAPVYILNLDSGAWTTALYPALNDDWQTLVWIQVRSPDGQGTMLAGSTTGFLYDLRFTSLAFDAAAVDGSSGVPYTSTLQSHSFDFSDASKVKALRFGYAGAEANAGDTITVKVVDDSGSFVNSQTVTPGAGVTRFQLWGNYKSPGLQLTHSGFHFVKISDLWIDAFVYNRPS